jgi:hypothetical protein
MTFTRYPCWPADRVSAVMNPDAENIADDVFLAVHFDHELVMVDPGARSGGEQQRSARHRWKIAPGAFLHNFLTSDRRQAYAAVLGAAGSGKSHFIHWLALNIPQRDDLYIHSIPKTGTNLRGVLERIIDVLPTDRAMKYREVLNATGYSNATHEQRQERLLSEIALSIGTLQVQSDAPNAEAEEWLISELPTLFHDPHYRARISQPNGIIEQLVEHISEPPRGYERREERRAFRLDDLPLSGVATLDLSLEARKFFNVLLSNQHLVPLAVQIINRSLNAAISGVLNFRGDQLLELMLDVRRYLRAEGKALVLLIEDLARLQGVDAALLQALIEAPSDGPEGLCDLRWAAAVTRGYYEQLPDTVKSRMDFLIDMDLPLDALGPDSIAAFAARYLKAVRLQKDELLSWYNTGLDSGSRASVPNRCDDCPYQKECHASFGAVDSVGLYPFNHAALRTMAERKDPDIFDRFNPRRFIKMVLGEVMGTRRQEIDNGEFPDNSLLQYMGGSQLPSLVEDQLKRANPIDFERQRTVLELWGIPGQPVPLPDGLFTAFSLKPPILPRSSSPASTTTNSPDTASYRQGSQEPIAEPTLQREVRIIQAVQRWAQGDNMPQWAANVLRDLVYTALEDYIDWDTVGLERKGFMQRKRSPNVPFHPLCVHFLRQETQEFISSTSINLKLPLDTNNEDDLRRTAIALESLLQFKSHKSWDFPNAFQGLVVLGECLAQWSAELLTEFKRPPGADTGWDSVASAVEVLAVGAALGGKLSASKLTTTDKLNVLFDEKWPEQLPDQAAKEWEKLYEGIRTNADKLRELVRTWASATKGGQAGAMVNPLLLLPPLRHVLRTWKLTKSSPNNSDQMREPYRTLARLHANVRTSLPEIVASEYRRRMEWLELVRRYMDENTTRAQVVESARQLGDAIANEGINVHQSVRKKFDEAFEAFKTVQLDNAIKAAQQLQDVSDPIAALPALVPDRTASAMMAADRFFAAADALITETEAALKTKLADLDVRVGEQLQRDRQVINDSLEKLEQALSVIGGEAC